MSAITVTPDPFTLVPYDAAEIRALLEEAAALAGLPPTADIALDGRRGAVRAADRPHVRRRRRAASCSGSRAATSRTTSGRATSRPTRPASTSWSWRCAPTTASRATSPTRRPTRELSRGERAAWDTYAVGRAGRLGLDVRRPRQLYDFRLQHGFTDVADAAFERCWHAERITWDGVREICKETGGVDRGPSKVPVDLLRQK